jgi:hypothetical protein
MHAKRKARYLGDQMQKPPRELLGSPEEDDQQPSPESNLSEGSTTSSNVLTENMKDHERGASIPFKEIISAHLMTAETKLKFEYIFDDDIV